MLRCHADAREHIDELARRAHDGALLIMGEVGSGKSALLGEALERYGNAASLVRVNGGESHWPLSGVAALMAAVGDPRTAEFTGRFVLRSDDDAALGEAAAELLALLRGLGLPRTLLLVDDIDRMDAVSREIVGYMAGHLAGSGIRLVATTTELSPDEPLAGLPSTVLPRLDEHDIADLAPAGIDAGTLRILGAASGGNLATFTSLLGSLSEDQFAGRDALRLPPRPGPPAWAALAQTTRRLGAAHAEVLDRLATAPLHVRRAVSAWADDAEDALEELIDLGVAREKGGFVALVDPLVRSALSDALPARARRELHGRLTDGCGSLLEAWHASWADPSRDMRAPLVEAAVEAARLGHADAAVEFADRAIRPGRHGLARALTELAEELLARGESELADRYLRIASADRRADIDDRVRLATARLRADYLTGRGADAHEVPTARADPELVVRWTASFAAIAAARGDVAAARGPLARLEELSAAEPTGPTRSLAALARSLLAGAASGRPTPSDDERDPLALALHARAAIFAEDYAAGRSLIGRLARELDEASRMWTGWLTSLAIDCAARAGRIGEALELARDWGARHPDDAGPPGLVPISAWTRLADDDLVGADAVLAAWTDGGAARAGPLPTARGLLLRAELARLQGDDDTACELLLLADALTAQLDDPALCRHLPELAEVLMSTGRVAAAQQAARRLLAAATTHPSRWAVLAAARAAVATAAAPELRARYAEALSLHRPDDSGFELGKLRLVASRRLADAGAASEAERAAADARIAFAGAGARPWAASPTSVALAAGAAERSAERLSPLLAELTPDERAVVELVVRGLHNKEIASTLFLSVRTVELRLTRIYRKVGARSRAHLVSLMS